MRPDLPVEAINEKEGPRSEGPQINRIGVTQENSADYPEAKHAEAMTSVFANLPKNPGEAAVAYAEKLGWRIMPLHSMLDGRCSCGHEDCEAPAKHPLIKSADASNDPKRIKAWWKKWPHANIGFWMEGSGLAVVDVDISPGKDGPARLNEILKDQPLPETLVAATPSGGKHIYFKDRDGLPNKSNALGSGLDLWRGKHYVILPPSNHKSGGSYVWDNPHEIAEYPDILLPPKRPVGRPPTKSKQPRPFDTRDPDEKARLKYALTFCNASDRDTWVQFGYALARAFNRSEEGWQIFREWAATADNYNAKESHGIYWRDSKNDDPNSNPITVATIFDQAAKHPNYTPWTKDDARVRFINDPDNMDKSLTELGSIVVAVRLPLYRREKRLVEIIRYEDMTEVERDHFTKHFMSNGIDIPPGTTLMMEMTPLSFEAMASGKIRWEQRSRGKLRSGPFNQRTVSAFLALVAYWDGIPIIRALQPVPTIRSLEDRTIIHTQGLDVASGLYLTEALPIQRPSHSLGKKHALDLLQVVLAPFKKYHMFDDAGEAIVVATILTSITRHCYRTVPGVVIEAAKPSSGKTKLAQALAVISQGRRLPTLQYTSNDEELGKRIGAAKLVGVRDLLLDNVKERMDSQIIEAMMTEQHFHCRVLGTNDLVTLPNDGILFITGNGMVMSPDMRRRFLTVVIDSGEQAQAAQQGEFNFDPPDLALKNRREIIAAALGIIQAFEDSHGRSKLDADLAHKKRRPVASFEDWSYIRDIVLWLGYPDLGRVLEANLEMDDDDASFDKVTVLNWMVTNANGKSAAEIAATLSDSTDSADAAVRAIFVRGRRTRGQSFQGEALSPESIGRGLRKLCLLNTSWPYQDAAGAKFTVQITKDSYGKYSVKQKPS